MTEVYTYFTPWHVVWLAIGGGFGAALRFSIGQALAPKQSATGWPWATWWVNISGAGLLGFLAAYFQAQAYSAAFFFWELGLLGGFTTTSTLSLEVFRLGRSGQVGKAFAYAISSLVGALCALAVGFKLGGLL